MRKQRRENQSAAQAATVGPLAQVAALAATKRPKTGDKIPRLPKILPFLDLDWAAEDGNFQFFLIDKSSLPLRRNYRNDAGLPWIEISR